MTNQPPSQQPSNDGSFSGTMRTVLEKFLQGIDDMIPARVISFDRATNRATVQPLLMMVKTDNSSIQRAQVVNVPVVQLSGGGFVINFPLNPGDIGHLKANDRDLSIFRQSYSFAPPNTFRKHSFEDSVFFPDQMRGWTVTEEGLVLQNMSGSECIAILDNTIKIKSSTEVIIDAPLLTVKGDILAEGEIMTQEGGGITLSTHRHSGVQTGIGNTGVAIP
jgi:hypothetical protein